MLHYRDRSDKIYIVSLDRFLLEDIYERLHEYPGLETIELIRPGSNGSPIKPEEILQLSRDTLSARILIMDVRNQTLPLLQRSYSDIIRFNRPDLNNYCCTILVGDGPRNFLHPDRGVKTLPSFIADLRNNFSAAAFFGDPFLFYTAEEIQEMAAIDHNLLPEKISRRFYKYFDGGAPTIDYIRRYFRAADKQNGEKLSRRTKRQRSLKKLYLRMILDEFPNAEEQVRAAISKEGLEVPGETLRCNIYPFHFEECVRDTLQKTLTAK